ncbi:LysR family transcriptional regulator [Microbulbifer hainanensis]|uniref:LysR family transcriptional regulator n=1 Tax=Microbulbifer hainanensis TaxID=2735675 RepID=UPI001866CEAC|nr:LysR family transcriptional regulator [Microbulbifer hainanensis]
MQVDDWNHVQYALAVARAGTLSGAAQQLGVSHSTVLRRVDALEKNLRTQLFYRHARGYVPTEAGRRLAHAAESMQDQLNLLVERVHGPAELLRGNLAIHTDAELVSPLLPLLQRFQRRHPELRLQMEESTDWPGSHRGEVRVGLRVSARPNEAGCAVQSLPPLGYSLYASDSYLRNHGELHSLDAIDGHRFISCADNDDCPAFKWLRESVPERQIKLHCGSQGQLLEAARAGFGIAPLCAWRARGDDGLRRLLPPPNEWRRNLWLYCRQEQYAAGELRAFSDFIGEYLARLQRMRPVGRGAR